MKLLLKLPDPKFQCESSKDMKLYSRYPLSLPWWALVVPVLMVPFIGPSALVVVGGVSGTMCLVALAVALAVAHCECKSEKIQQGVMSGLAKINVNTVCLSSKHAQTCK